MGMKKTLLIVEDNLILCDILERWLQKAGYGVLTAIDEPSARRKIKGNNVALVLTDVRLPEGDGISLLEWSISQGLHIPFVGDDRTCLHRRCGACRQIGRERLLAQACPRGVADGTVTGIDRPASFRSPEEIINEKA